MQTRIKSLTLRQRITGPKEFIPIAPSYSRLLHFGVAFASVRNQGEVRFSSANNFQELQGHELAGQKFRYCP